MDLYTQAADITVWMPHDSSAGIPMLRFHVKGVYAPDPNTFLYGCTRVHLSFEINSSHGREAHETERVVVHCYARIAGTQEPQLWITVCASFPKHFADQMREYASEAGFWWLIVQFNDNERHPSFMVDPFGEIISRHVVCT